MPCGIRVTRIRVHQLSVAENQESVIYLRSFYKFFILDLVELKTL